MRRPRVRPKLAGDELLARVRGAVATGCYRILPHARRRCSEREVTAPHIEQVLETGHRVPRRDRFAPSEQDWSYCFEGRTVDGARLRVVVAFDQWMLVVTVVRLERREG